ncbi:MAG: hypothetical protein ACXAB5_05705 [Candidatus Thorarchaeota archaeon]
MNSSIDSREKDKPDMTWVLDTVQLETILASYGFQVGEIGLNCPGSQLNIRTLSHELLKTLILFHDSHPGSAIDS